MINCISMIGLTHIDPIISRMKYNFVQRFACLIIVGLRYIITHDGGLLIIGSIISYSIARYMGSKNDVKTK